MSDETKARRLHLRFPHPHLPHLTLTQVRVLRLFGLLFVFSLLVLYAVFRSTRFQDLMRRKSEKILREALNREVAIGGFDLALVPPAFLVKDVHLANDPRGLPGDCFSAEEISLRGVPTITGSRLDLPKVRLVAPRLVFEIFPDGSTNFPKMPSPDGTGDRKIELRLGEALVQQGTIRFREWKAELDVLLRDALVTARSPAFSRATQIELLCRTGKLKLEKNEELEFSLAAEARLSPGRAHLTALRLRSNRIRVDANGGIEDLSHPVVTLSATASTRGEELKRLFGVGLPLEGALSASGTIRIMPGAGFRIRGRFELPDGRFGPLPMKGSGFVRVDPSGLLAHLAKAEYAGGELEAFVRVARLNDPPLPVRLLIRGRDVGLEAFLGDLDLRGTGLMARADLETTLTFARGGIEKSNGAGFFRLREAPRERSAVAGRHALPTSGGGPIQIRDGKLIFPKTPIVTAGGAHLTMDGSLTIGPWTPDFDITLAADDLSEVERIVENFYPAINKQPLGTRLRLSGSGGLVGRFERSFGDPRVSGRFTASDFSLFGARFGAATADFVVDHADGPPGSARETVLTLAPFEAHDGGGAVSATGRLGWGGRLAGHYRLQDLAATFDRFPLERMLKFLDFDLPLTGLITGRLPLDGVTPDLTGSVPFVWTDAKVWGQAVDRVEGTLSLEKDHLRMAGVTAAIGGGSLTGEGSYRYADRGFTLAAEARDLPLRRIDAVSEPVPALAGLLNGSLSGEGTVERPRLSGHGTLRGVAWGDKPFGGPDEVATLDATSAEGGFRVGLSIPSAGRLEMTAPPATAGSSDVTDVSVSLDLQSLAPFAPFLPLDKAAGVDGRLFARAVVARTAEGEPTRATGSVDRAQVRLYGQTLDLKSPAAFRISDGRVFLEPTTILESATGPSPATSGAQATVSGSLELDAPHALDVTASGLVDASLLRVAVTDATLAGPIAFDVRATGTTAEPVLTGRISLDGVDYAGAGTARPIESITGTLRLVPGRIQTDGVSARWSGGTVSVSGSVGLAGLDLDGVRLNATLGRVRTQPFEGFSAVLSGNVVLTGQKEIESARGALTFDRGFYDAPMNLGLGALLRRFRSASPPSSERTPFDGVTLDVSLDAPPGSIEIRNNVAHLKASGALVLRGTFGTPVILGEIDAEEGGRLELRGLRYELRKAELVFSNPVRIDPFFDIEAQTRIRGSVDYDVTLGLSGTFSRVSTRLVSDPPLSEAQIVSIIATGQAPSGGALGSPGGTTTASTDKSIRDATRDLLTGLAADEAADRARKFLRLDRLQIDPVFAGNGFDAPRLTIGKSITPELTVTYSYKASANQEQIIIVDYQLTNTSAIQFLRDEYGVYSVELKFRTRLR